MPSDNIAKADMMFSYEMASNVSSSGHIVDLLASN